MFKGPSYGYTESVKNVKLKKKTLAAITLLNKDFACTYFSYCAKLNFSSELS